MGDTVPDVPDLDSRTLQVARRALEDGSITLEQLISALRAMWLDRSAPDDLLAALVLGEAVQPDQAVRLNRMVEIGADDDDPAIFLPDPKQRYEPGDLLGSGGMGVVQLVHDRNLGRDVAMKRLHADLLGEDESMGALIMEARVAGMLEHPNIIPVYDVGLTGNDEPFYTMRLMEQLCLGDACCDGATPKLLGSTRSCGCSRFSRRSPWGWTTPTAAA